MYKKCSAVEFKLRYCLTLPKNVTSPGNQKSSLKLVFGSQNRSIPIYEVASELGENLSMSLPVVHALSGCDPANALFWIEKKRWNTAVKKYRVLKEGIRELGDDQVYVSNADKLAVAQTVSFILWQTGEKQLMALDMHCSQRKDYPVNNFHQPIALNQHIRSSNYQCYIWKSATRWYLNLPSPLQAG